MKKNDLIPQYLQDELNSLVRIKTSYTDKEIAQVKRDYDHVMEQLKQLEEAEKYGAISEEEFAITNLVLYIKKYVIEETISDMKQYLQAERDAILEKIKNAERVN